MAENNQNTGNATEPGAQAQQQNQTQQNQNTTTTIDYDALAKAVERGVAQKENAVLNGYFKELGITGDEAKQAIEAFKSQKAKNTVDLADENKQLKAQILQGKIDNAVNKAATELGISTENLPFVTKLADLSKVTNDKGEVDSEAISSALKKVLEDVPAFKSTEDKTKGFQVGGKGAETEKTDEAEKRLRAAFGLK